MEGTTTATLMTVWRNAVAKVKTPRKPRAKKGQHSKIVKKRRTQLNIDKYALNTICLAENCDTLVNPEDIMYIFFQATMQASDVSNEEENDE